MRLNIRWAVGPVIAALLVACGETPEASTANRLQVVATTTQVGSVASEIGGADIDLTVLLRAGEEAHDFELTPAAAAAIEEADLILVSGAGLESWLDDALATIGDPDAVRDTSEGVQIRAAADGETDPHYWLSGPNAIVMVENVRDALIAADAESTDGFATRAGELVGRLEAADADVRRLLGEIPEARRGIVTNHDALGYFIDEYGLRFVGSVFPSLDVSAEPNPAQLAELIEVLRAEGVTAVFSESAVSPRLAQAIAAEAGATVVDEPLYTDSLGPERSGAETLDGMLLHNGRVIHDALVGSS